MYKLVNRTFVFTVFLLMGFGLVTCEKQEGEEMLLGGLGLCGLEMDDMELYDLLVLPENPNSGDQISIIEKICGSESDVILSFQGNQIGYKRYVNSLMMMPCSPQLDTTIIGQLNPGNYQLVQCIIDKNHLITDSIVRQDTLTLLVSE